LDNFKIGFLGVDRPQVFFPELVHIA
jgi:hypothetical protein